jgi:hypothetical protein
MAVLGSEQLRVEISWTNYGCEVLWKYSSFNLVWVKNVAAIKFKCQLKLYFNCT